MAEPKDIQGGDEVLGSERSEQTPISRRDLLKGAAAAIGGYVVGRATAGLPREGGTQGAEATIILERDRYYASTGGVLREAHLSGERVQLTGRYESNVSLITRSHPSSLAQQERADISELADQFSLFRIKAAYGPVYQLDIPVVVLQKIPPSYLTIRIDRESGGAAYLSTRDLVTVLNAQNPDHPTAKDDKVSFFFYARDPEKGDLVRHEHGKPILNVIPLPPFAERRLGDNNIGIKVRIDHVEDPKFGMHATRQEGWTDLSGETEALEMTIKPKAQAQPNP